MRNPESSNNVPPNEPFRIHVPNVRKGSDFHPFREVINSDEEPSSVTSSPWEWTHYVQAPMGK